MSLKDEMENLIEAKRKELESNDLKEKKETELQYNAFQPMCIKLKEIFSSIEPKYFILTIKKKSATIKLGRDKKNVGDFRESHGELFIAPRGEHKDLGNGIEFHLLPGFVVQEKDFGLESRNWSMPHTFETEDAVTNHLLPIIAETVANLRHRE
jgi:hypothetical protein